MSEPIISGTVIGAEAVQIRLLEAGAGARKHVQEKVQRLGLELLRLVKEKLTGVSLNVRTGRLRRGVNEKTTVTDTEVTSSTGTNVVYARPWEFGFSGMEQVRSHLRRSRSGTASTVRAHQRQANMKARPFLRPSLDEMRPKVTEQLSRGVL